MQKLSQKRVLVKIRRFWRKFLALDWTDPLNILLLVALLILPFVAKVYISTGILLGLIMTVSILWFTKYLPNSMIRMIKQNPLIADLVLSSFAIATIGLLFGQGLTLAIGAAICALLISFCIPFIKPRRA